MKRQLDRLKGKRLVTGDPNLMTKDEICINATPNGVEVKEIGTDGKIKDLAGSGDSGGGTSEVKERWVSIKSNLPDGEPTSFKDFTIYYRPTKLGYQVLNELCDMFIGLAPIPYTSGDGYAISGGTMNIGELNNIRKGVHSDGRDDQFFKVRAVKFREVSNSNKFIDIAAGAPQHSYYGGLGNLDTLYTILLNHNFWNDKSKEERLFLTIFIYNLVILSTQSNEDAIIYNLYDNDITIENLFIQNGFTEEMLNAFNVIYINKEEELNKVIEYVNNYNGHN